MVENWFIYLSLHVDDFLCVGTEADCQLTKAVLKKQFKLKLTKDIIHLGIKIKYISKVTLEYYRESRLLSLKSYVDLDWASSDGCKSTSRMVYLLNDSVIAWSSKKQTIIALSTGEAEYIAASKCTKEVVYLRQLLSELSYPQCTLTPIHEDNQTCIHSLGMMPSTHTQNTLMKYHFTRFQIDEDMITLVDTRMEDQLMDLFTKQ
jgi:hypothetical protein